MAVEEQSNTSKAAISRLAHRYYLYDVASIKRIREDHNILGCFIGTLPQHNQQNVFLGLPLELLAEEARLLVEKDVAYIVNDAEVHNKQMKRLTRDERQKYRRGLARHGLELAKSEQKRRDDDKQEALNKMSEQQRERVIAKMEKSRPSGAAEGEAGNNHESLFGPHSPTQSATSSLPAIEDLSVTPKSITPTTSHPPLPLPTPPASPTSNVVPFPPQEPSYSQRRLPPTPRPSSPASPTREGAPAYPPFSPFSPFSQHPQRQPPQQTTPPASTTSPSPPATTPTPSIKAPFSNPSKLHSTDSPHHATPSHPHPQILPPVPNLPAYHLYAHLHSNHYFQTPGLRFGAHFCVYPGDPVRYHSHFLARGYAWREEMRLMDLVGGGRLGTGVKKGFLIGGPREGTSRGRWKDGAGTKLAGKVVEGDGDDDDDDDDDEECGGVGGREGIEGAGADVRVFCVEWAGM